MIDQFWDLDKAGTMILSYYRSGSHFVYDLVRNGVPGTIGLGEVDTLSDLNVSATHYNVAIANCVNAKFDMVSNPLPRSQWHVVKLTRRDKVGHFISSWFWSQNSLSEQYGTGRYKHHDTPAHVYRSALGSKVHYDIGALKIWLQEQLILEFLPVDVSVDYADLQTMSGWRPNDYSDIGLSDLFTNSDEIQRLLENFRI